MPHKKITQYIKKITNYFTVILILLSTPLQSQLQKKLNRLEDAAHCAIFNSPHIKKDIGIIKKNWKQYFSYNIFDSLDFGKNYYPIWLDSYGYCYDFNQSNIDYSKMTTRKIKDKHLTKYSIYSAVKHTEVKNCRWKRAKKDKNINAAADFYKNEWGKIHEDKIDSLIDCIKQKPKVLFYIHGYNVPYALAAIQFKAVLDSLTKTNEFNENEFTLIPIFWSSNDSKNKHIEGKKIKINNKIRLRNASKFTPYKTRSIMAGFTLRKILNKIPKGKEIFIFSHSLGNSMVASALGNNLGSETIKLYEHVYTDGKLPLTTSSKTLIPFCNEVRCRMEESSIPSSKKLSVFMSAAAISAKETFESFNSDVFRFSKFYITINQKDKILKKFIGLSRFFNKTTMGLNKFGDVYDLYPLFGNNTENLITLQTKYNSNHSIFSYLLDKRYKNGITKFIKNEPDTIENNSLKKFNKKLNELLNRVYYYTLDTSYCVGKKVNNDAFDYFIKDGIHLSVIGHEWQTVNFEALELRDLLIKNEKSNYYNNELLSTTKEMINSIKNPYALVLLERSFNELNIDTVLRFKTKLVNEISLVQNLITKNNYVSYAYESKKRDVVKFIHISTGNDLFNPGSALFNATKKNKFIRFPANQDRDYTGNFIVEVGTDYLNLLKRKPVKCYQTIFYGFDVFTPFFKDSVYFYNFDSINRRDRPHASFEYFGVAKYGLSKHNRFRWKRLIKVGVIGGKIGEKFQNVLHRDVSSSPLPKGWQHQIAAGGRLGFSAEGQLDALVLYKPNLASGCCFHKIAPKYISTSIAGRVGTYITDARIGLEISNKNFKEINHHQMVKHTKQGTPINSGYFMYRIGGDIGYVIHNSMLMGFGIFSRMQPDDTVSTKLDPLIPRDVNYLNRKDIYSYTGQVYAKLSYSARKATVFFNWHCFSPETKFKNTFDASRTAVGYTKQEALQKIANDVSKRWHRFATIGIIYHIQ